MLKSKKGPGSLLSLCLVGLMALIITFPAQAAAKKATETRTPISSVTLNINSYIEAGDDYGHIEVGTNDSNYSIGNTDWGTTPSSGWAVGAAPKIKIYLHARGGYYFEKAVSKKTVVVNGATLTTVKKADNDETLVLSIELKKVKGELDEPENAEWVGYPVGRATWEKVANATAYELKLFRDNQLVYSVEKCVGNTFDFYPYMNQVGKYEFRVRAIPVSSEESEYMIPGDWANSDETRITEDDTLDAKYKGENDNKVNNPGSVGWVEMSDGWKYRRTDGSFVSNSWQAINGKWYYFGYDGYMQTGWQNIGGNTYYLTGNGDMHTGWLEYDRSWYYLDANTGAMQRGWVSLNGRWYYMQPTDGKMHTGWLLVNGKWYYMDPNQGGAMAQNTSIGGYYVNQDGVWLQ